MTRFYLILLGILCSLPVKANSPGVYENTELSASTTPALVSWGGKLVDGTVGDSNPEKGQISILKRENS